MRGRGFGNQLMQDLLSELTKQGHSNLHFGGSSKQSDGAESLFALGLQNDRYKKKLLSMRQRTGRRIHSSMEQRCLINDNLLFGKL